MSTADHATCCCADTLAEVARLTAERDRARALAIRLEAEAAKPQGDIFWSSSANTLGAFKALLEPYRSPELSAIPAALHHPQNLWSRPGWTRLPQRWLSLPCGTPVPNGDSQCSSRRLPCPWRSGSVR
jgi:hypothetical protein